MVVVTPTASGKTLCYNLPILNALVENPEARAMYLFPTKALSQDQLVELNRWTEKLGDEIRTFTYDGDTPQDARRAIRSRGNLVITNPDMLHAGILPHHTKWAALFENLRYVVIDELHYYRGVFGSHLGQRPAPPEADCDFYGSQAAVHLTSATIANPGELADPIIERRCTWWTKTARLPARSFRLLQSARREPATRHPPHLYLNETRRIARTFLVATLQSSSLPTRAWPRKSWSPT